MSLLTICQDAAAEIKIVKPTSIVGNTDDDPRHLFRLANKVGITLKTVYPWQIIRKEHTFTALGQEEQTGILPDDFNRVVIETFWNRTQNYLCSGPITPVEWQGFKARGYQDPQPKFILRGGAIHIMPAPDAGDTLAFEYVSDEWCQSNGSVAQTVWKADTDTAIISEELITRGIIWQYLVAKSLPADHAASDFNDHFNQLMKNDNPRAKILVAGDIFQGTGSRHFSGTPTTSGSETVI